MKASTTEKIISAALDEFAAFGFNGARMDRIASKAEINKAMIYYHYKSKEALYEKILFDITNDLSSFIQQDINQQDSSLDGFYNLIRHVIKYLESKEIQCVQMLFRELGEGGKYIKKIIFARITIPLLESFMKRFEIAKNENRIRDINPLYSYFQVLGSIIFLSSLRITLDNFPIKNEFYKEGYIERMSDNLIDVIKYGIEKRSV